MKETQVRLGVVGLGRGMIAQKLLGTPNVQITAVCDRNPEKLQAAVDALKDCTQHLQAFDNFDDFLRDADVNAVFVATEAIYHVPYVIRLLEAGKHVISEIPAVNSIEEAKLLKAAVLAHPECKYMVAENCCYWAFIQAWKMMYEDGKFGETVYAEAEYLHGKDFRDLRPEDYPPDHWRSFNPAIKYLTHDLGPLLYIMNDRCVSVACMEPDVQYNPYTPNKKGNGVAIFKTAKGAVIRILICFDAFVDAAHNYSLIGTRGTIETEKTKLSPLAHSFASFSDIPGSRVTKVEIPITRAFHGEPTDGHGGADRKMLQAFVRCILEDTPPPLDVDFAIKISVPGIIAHESAVQGGTALEIPEI